MKVHQGTTEVVSTIEELIFTSKQQHKTLSITLILMINSNRNEQSDFYSIRQLVIVADIMTML